MFTGKFIRVDSEFASLSFYRAGDRPSESESGWPGPKRLHPGPTWPGGRRGAAVAKLRRVIFEVSKFAPQQLRENFSEILKMAATHVRWHRDHHSDLSRRSSRPSESA
jgi:hypothetical protein